MEVIKPLDKIDREALLQRRREINDAYNAAMDSEDYDKGDELLPMVDALDQEYFERLPRIIVSACPFCAKPLQRSFDPFGFDGPWWSKDSQPAELPTCPHFCVLSGAVNFRGKPPKAGDFEVIPGPEVPYVMPRLLEMPGMVAVISHLEMDNGYLAYPIAYFAERRPPPQDLTSEWRKLSFTYKTQLEESGWDSPNDLWDFDLRPWLEKGKIRWTMVDDPGRLSADPPTSCPYVDLPGKRDRYKVKGSDLWTIGLPDGKSFDPWD